MRHSIRVECNGLETKVNNIKVIFQIYLFLVEIDPNLSQNNNTQSLNLIF